MRLQTALTLSLSLLSSIALAAPHGTTADQANPRDLAGTQIRSDQIPFPSQRPRECSPFSNMNLARGPGPQGKGLSLADLSESDKADIVAGLAEGVGIIG